MNWKREAVLELRKHSTRVAAIEALRERIAVLEIQYRQARTSSTESVSGDKGHHDDALVGSIAERERLKINLQVTKRLVALTEMGLESLTAQQRLILRRFFMEPGPGAVEKLSEEIHLERSRIYELKDEALYIFTIAMYGITEL